MQEVSEVRRISDQLWAVAAYAVMCVISLGMPDCRMERK